MVIPFNLFSDQTGLTLEAQPMDASNAAIGSPLTAGFQESGGGGYKWTVQALPGGTATVKIQLHSDHSFLGIEFSLNDLVSIPAQIFQDTTTAHFTVPGSAGISIFTGKAPGDIAGGLLCNNAAIDVGAFIVNGSTSFNGITAGEVNGTLARCTLVDAVTANAALTGPSSVTLTFLDGSSNPVANVIFSIKSSGTVIATGQADGNGVAEFGVEDGDYTVVAAITGGVLFSATGLVVSGDGELAITGTGPPAPLANPGSGKVLAQGYVYNGTDAAAGETVYYKMVGMPDGDGAIYDGTVKSTVSDDIGFVSVELFGNASYLFFRARGSQEELATTDVSPVAIPRLISDETANP
jgi:hypothetical protein